MFKINLQIAKKNMFILYINMNIINLNNFNTTFSSGLNNKILLKEKNINIQQEEEIFLNKYGIETRFNTNKSGALANSLCVKIFEKLFKHFNSQMVLPPTIYMYKKNEIIDTNNAPNFCISDTKNVLKNDYPFPGRAIFFLESLNLKEIDDKANTLFYNKESSSSHFLSPFIHEWLHSIQLDYIYRKYGYGGDCDYLKDLYPKKSNISGVLLLKKLETRTLTQKENEIIFDVLGNYSTRPINQYLEIFSEAFTKFICNSLSGANLIKNPMDEIKKTNKEFQKILKKVCSL